jgi:hypothetical protein
MALMLGHKILTLSLSLSLSLSLTSVHPEPKHGPSLCIRRLNTRLPPLPHACVCECACRIKGIFKEKQIAPPSPQI